jgi:predicted metal-dependent enzyme (double-stranded beta helix superfamily)
MRAAETVMKQFVLDPDLQSSARDWPSTEPCKNPLFYEDPDFGFAINGVTRSPGYRGGVHDHSHAWVLYGVIEGTESLERFNRIDDRTTPGFAELKKSSTTDGHRGRVDLVPAYGIHAEQGGPVRSAALILRSERVAGRVLQNGYDLTATRCPTQGTRTNSVPALAQRGAYLAHHRVRAAQSSCAAAPSSGSGKIRWGARSGRSL